MLLPDLGPRLASLSPALLAALAADVTAVASTLAGLKQVFPRADVARMCAREPRLALTRDVGRLAALAAELKALLPGADVDRIVAEHPSFLDTAGVAAALAEAARIAPTLDIVRAVSATPELLFRFQSGALLIPYDQFADGTATGGQDARGQ